jgi:hypothetical protein
VIEEERSAQVRLEQDAVIIAALAAADRVTRYRTLRMFTVVGLLLVSIFVGVNTYKISNLNGDLCARTIENRTAVRELAEATLITTPIPANVDPATRAQILASRADRKQQVDHFLIKYPGVSC